MPNLTPEVIARLAFLDHFVLADWQQKHTEYDPEEIIAGLDGGHGEDGAGFSFDPICTLSSELSGAQLHAIGELIPLMRNSLKTLLDSYRAWITIRDNPDFVYVPKACVDRLEADAKGGAS